MQSFGWNPRDGLGAHGRIGTRDLSLFLSLYHGRAQREGDDLSARKRMLTRNSNLLAPRS